MPTALASLQPTVNDGVEAQWSGADLALTVCEMVHELYLPCPNVMAIAMFPYDRICSNLHMALVGVIDVHGRINNDSHRLSSEYTCAMIGGGLKLVRGEA